jgi:hypothetical protein
MDTINGLMAWIFMAALFLAGYHARGLLGLVMVYDALILIGGAAIAAGMIRRMYRDREG